jgi:hypothetical protein
MAMFMFPATPQVRIDRHDAHGRETSATRYEGFQRIALSLVLAASRFATVAVMSNGNSCGS